MFLWNNMNILFAEGMMLAVIRFFASSICRKDSRLAQLN